MNLKTTVLYIFLSQIICLSAFANGDPVLRYSSINRVAVPEPLDVSEIEIIDEKIKISHIDGYNSFDVTYRLKNKSDKDFPELHYGFPIDYLVADEQEIYDTRSHYYVQSLFELGWNEMLIKDVSFSLDGRELPFRVSKESVKEAGFDVESYEWDGTTVCDTIPIEGVNRRWFYTELSIGPKAQVDLNVQYKVYAGGSVSLESLKTNYSYIRERNTEEEFTGCAFFDRYLSSSFSILYDFTPAKHFGDDNDYVLNIDIDLSKVNHPTVQLDDYKCNVSHLKRRQYSRASAFKPINMRVGCDVDFSQEHIEKLISEFRISEDYYRMKNGKDCITLDFRKPCFISEIACDIDTAEIKSFDAYIEYADGRQVHSVYAKHPGYAQIESTGVILQCDNLLPLFVVTEEDDRWESSSLYKTHIYNDLDSDRFKVKSIRFTFPEGQSSKSAPAMRNIRPIDSRFSKKQ
ncbi:MAG: hypothetical protein K2I64_03010 [Muribaculaceae bacterium]|nr:hypothetical protein [Muribaculaceae bacterium]